MQTFIERLQDFYVVDQATVMLIALFCGWAAFHIRAKIANIAFLVFLYPLCLLVSVTVLSLAMHLELVSLRKASDWIMYSVTAAAIGSMVGITMVAMLRRLVDVFTMRTHIKASIRRDEEDAGKGYERMHL